MNDLAVKLDWGDVPSYLAVLLTFGTLLLSLWLIRREQGIREDQEENLHRHQASQVACWAYGKSMNSSDGGQISTEVRIPVVSVKNASALPIYDVEIRAEGSKIAVWDCVPPGELVDMETAKLFATKDLRLSFVDGVGVSWTHDLGATKGLVRASQ